MPPTKPTPDIPTRLPITNQLWNAERMLAKALAGGYPSAKSNGQSREVPGLTDREAEIAYWRGRCGLGEEAMADIERDLSRRAQQEAALGDRKQAEDAGDADDLDARFVKLSGKQQRSIIHSYLTSRQPSSLKRAAELCVLTNRCLGQELRDARRHFEQQARRSISRMRAGRDARTKPLTPTAPAEATLWTE